MPSLYSRLFRYKAGPDREPLEDFLSEALADLFTRMPKDDLAEFLRWAFHESTKPIDWSHVVRKDVKWVTQEILPGGIADMVLYLDGKPVLVIENKTWSGFQDHSREKEEANQLTTYCKWLAAVAPCRSDCAILLITGTTSAPEGFHGDGNYEIAVRGQITWAAVGRWLGSRLPPEGMASPTWLELASDLIAFLKEKKLSSEIFTTADLSAANLMLPTMERWRSTFSAMWSGADDVCREFLNARTSDLAFHPSGGLLWQYRYGKPAISPPKTYVGLALRFPEYSDWFVGYHLPEQPHFCVMVMSDNGTLEYSGELPPKWIYDASDGEFVIPRAVHTLPTAPDLRIEELQIWAKSALADAQKIIAECDLT